MKVNINNKTIGLCARNKFYFYTGEYELYPNLHNFFIDNENEIEEEAEKDDLLNKKYIAKKVIL